MSKKFRIRSEKVPALTGFLGGLIFCFLGVVRMIPMFGSYGVIWVILSAIMTISAGYYFFVGGFLCLEEKDEQ